MSLTEQLTALADHAGVWGKLAAVIAPLTAIAALFGPPHARRGARLALCLIAWIAGSIAAGWLPLRQSGELVCLGFVPILIGSWMVIAKVAGSPPPARARALVVYAYLLMPVVAIYLALAVHDWRLVTAADERYAVSSPAASWPVGRAFHLDGASCVHHQKATLRGGKSNVTLVLVDRALPEERGAKGVWIRGSCEEPIDLVEIVERDTPDVGSVIIARLPDLASNRANFRCYLAVMSVASLCALVLLSAPGSGAPEGRAR